MIGDYVHRKIEMLRRTSAHRFQCAIHDEIGATWALMQSWSAEFPAALDVEK